MSDKIKVLFLSQWYPHRYDPMDGLFVRKHAQAVNLYCDVRVLYVYADANIKKYEIVKNSENGLRETTVYFPLDKSTTYYKILKVIRFFIAYYKGYKAITADGFKPNIVHSNVLTRTGAIAYLLKITKGIPYVITEHWSRYLASRNAYKGIFRQIMTRIEVRNAGAILPVSKTLENAMLSHNLFNANYQVVNNVVDDFFFETIPEIYRPQKRIIHISCFDEAAKNIKGILRATLHLSKIRTDFELILIGNGVNYTEIFDYSKQLGFKENIVHFLGEKPPEEVASFLQNSDLFVLFSNYETAGVVIAESLVCGKPVISTNVGIAPEYINDKNGRIINVGDEEALFSEMNYILKNSNTFNNSEIAKEAGEKFSYRNIGKKITDIYLKILN